MSTFEVLVTRVKSIEVHPNADAIEIAVIAGYRCIVKKNQFKADDLAIYIPEAAIIPEWLLEDLGLVGKLAGKDKNRVKAIRLRGVLSQGILLGVEYLIRDHVKGPEGPFWRDKAGDMQGPITLGQNLAENMGIVKWDPPVPTHLAGEVCNILGKTIKYDIENYQKFPDVIKEGELVAFTEKCHGTFTGIGLYPGLDHLELFHDGKMFVFSKGLGSQGLVFKNNEANKDNLYVRMLNAPANANVITAMMDHSKNNNTPIYFLGETFGLGIQDLSYGLKEPIFRVFDVYVGKPGEGRYLNFEEKEKLCNGYNISMVPLLYKGPFSHEIISIHRDGSETVSGRKYNIREGIVITPLEERLDNVLGRVILKAVSPDYLTRGGNVTEHN